MNEIRRMSIPLALIAAVLLSACGGGAAAPIATPTAQESVQEPTQEMAEEGMLPPVNPLEVSGDIVTAGSSTMFPLTEAMADRFRDEGYSGNITVDSIGSGAGFERFCVAAETDISNASRPIRDSEVESCQQNGRDPIQFRVGTDALAVTVSADNDFVDNLTIDELALVYSTAETWSDVRSEWPDEPIQRFSPGT
ncbi:MAG: substrate-binding domain-containing protein, partial [Anaerolineales bacterium]|nr:substrate-binding domain-containing protein [Anaerolineales bacterium]